MKRLIYLLPLVVVLVSGVYFAMGLHTDPRIIPSVLINKPVPDFKLAALKGRDAGLSSEDLKGEVSLLNVFGSWCIACREEHAYLRTLKKSGVITINGIDWRETDPDAGPAWLSRYGDPYTRVGADPDSTVAISLGVSGAPETFIVDATGTIRYKQIGPITEEVWKKTMLPIVQELRRK